MIITCPHCETRYTADTASFPSSGRKVRCSKGGHVWHQAAPEPERVLAPEPPVESTAAGEATTPVPAFMRPGGLTQQPPAKAPRRSWAERLGLIAGWTGLAAML